MNTQQSTPQDNPLIAIAELPSLDRIRPLHINAAVDALIIACDAAIERACAPDIPMTYESLNVHLDVPMQALEEAWSIVQHLKAVSDGPAMREAFAAAQPKVTALYTRLSSDSRLLDRYIAVLESERSTLQPAQIRALELEIVGFRLSGAELDEEQKSLFAESRLRSAALARSFSNNVLDATEVFALWATEDELSGVPEDVKHGLRRAAERDGKPDLFKCSLHQSALGAILQFADNRSLRETLYRASISRASELGPAERDNGPVLVQILALRQERAAFLGYANHAEVSLIPKMADSPEQVLGFLRDLASKVRTQAAAELAELTAYAGEHLGFSEVHAWDVAYVIEHLRRSRFGLREDEIRQYFRLDVVLRGLFSLSGHLFDINIVPESAAAWHPSVSCWRVERGGDLLGRFYYDAFARAGKQQGAWMSGAHARWTRPDSSVRKPMAFMTTNFSEPAANEPPLLSHREVVTLFHEFGHTLHFILTRVDVLGVSGISGVEWDAVELPSQLMENFAWERTALACITSHCNTGDTLPQGLLAKMLAARNFMVGLSMVRQIEFALFDMRIHTELVANVSVAAVQTVLGEVRAETSMLSVTADNRFQNSFSHVFTGGYAAGYYSYLWAEVLSADAWTLFEQSGVLSEEVGRRYREHVLERGGSRRMSENFRELMGRDPSIDALLRSRGVGACRAEEPVLT